MTQVTEYTCEICGNKYKYGHTADGEVIGYSTAACCSFCDGRRQERVLCAQKLDQAAHQVEVYRKAMVDAEERARVATASYVVLSELSRQRLGRIRDGLRKIVDAECTEPESTKVE